MATPTNGSTRRARMIAVLATGATILAAVVIGSDARVVGTISSGAGRSAAIWAESNRTAGGDPFGELVDSLFSSEASTTSVDLQTRHEAYRLLTTRLGNSVFAPADRDALAALIVRHARLTSTEARRRVDAAIVKGSATEKLLWDRYSADAE